MARGLRRTVGYQLLGVFALGAAAFAFADPLLRGGIAVAAGYAAGAPVRIGAARIDLREGRLQLWDVAVGNPEGYAAADFLRVRACEIELEPRSVGTAVLRIRRISLEGVSLMIERSPRGSNASTILASLVRGWSRDAADSRVTLGGIELRDARARIAFAPGLGRHGRTGVILRDSLLGPDEASAGGLPARLLAHRVLERIVDLALLRVIESGVYPVSGELETALRERVGPVATLPVTQRVEGPRDGKPLTAWLGSLRDDAARWLRRTLSGWTQGVHGRDGHATAHP